MKRVQRVSNRTAEFGGKHRNSIFPCKRPDNEIIHYGRSVGYFAVVQQNYTRNGWHYRPTFPPSLPVCFEMPVSGDAPFLLLESPKKYRTSRLLEFRLAFIAAFAFLRRSFSRFLDPVCS
ncbi:hypothetical protein TNCV_4231231 [Trichonephila clavipes]|uniref:Uncharacterized protein n=1 Tax=Trichonephila clavipes TaxID=2585209 RepID=A0A8X6SDN2_TRICX|nr:hypothetical protein TNCV_4231231 [Trichonephila clavipes]